MPQQSQRLSVGAPVGGSLQGRLQHPSTSIHSGSRGRLPVSRTLMSASSVRSPSTVAATTVWEPTRRRVPSINSTRWLESNAQIEPSRRCSIATRRSHNWAGPTSRSTSDRPIGDRHRRSWRSISTTSAPRRAAALAQLFPAGPPAMITIRFLVGRGYSRQHTFTVD
jgi:hypothetical protein